jgi:hypothetical protein
MCCIGRREEQEPDLAEEHGVPGREPHRLGHGLVVEHGAVLAAEIAHEPGAGGLVEVDLGVLARDRALEDEDAALARAPPHRRAVADAMHPAPLIHEAGARAQERLREDLLLADRLGARDPGETIDG